ncbi:MAG: cyclase family protein [Methanobacteriota archaeon]
MRPVRPWIDISRPIREGMETFPGDPAFRSEPVRSIAKGDAANVARLDLGTHTGTHVDGARHFLEGAPGVDRVPVDRLFGRARVLDLRDAPRRIGPSELRARSVPRGGRLLLRTRRTPADGPPGPAPREEPAHLAPEAARLIAQRGVLLVGIDELSIATGDESADVHRGLLSAGVVVLEGLDLSEAPPGSYDLIALPLRLHDGDGAPARAFVRFRGP